MLKTLTALLNLVYPPRCALCGAVEPACELLPRRICRSCLAALRLPPDGFAKTPVAPGIDCVSALYYTDAVRSAVIEFKFHGGQPRAAGFACMMSDAALAAGVEYDCVTWAPVSKKRLFERGYDQSRLLAHEFARLRGDREIRLLKKLRNTKKQSRTASRAEREENVKDVYAAVKTDYIKGKRVLLIDDIVTTGSTLRSASGALTAAGAGSVVCLTFAKAGEKSRARDAF